VAAKFITLAVPSVVGRVAMNATFLHKFGIPAAAATAQGAIDSFSGFLVEAAILLLAFLSSDIIVDVDEVDVAWGMVLLILFLLVIGTMLAIRFIKSVRERVFPVIRQGWNALVAVLREPRRAVGLFGANLATRLIMAGTLWLVLSAVGSPLAFGAALVAVVATNLLGGLVPVPGGIGVAEAAMTAFLVALGVAEPVAFAAALTYRVITFYLPALAGFPALRWLERNEYV
jgi:uncharacterized protein (TIRG00374 family)